MLPREKTIGSLGWGLRISASTRRPIRESVTRDATVITFKNTSTHPMMDARRLVSYSPIVFRLEID